jgi:hypothetical protein
VQIIAGPLGSQVFLGTHHVATGNQAWMRMDWGTDMASLTEGEILDELWAACMSLMEARTSIG